MMRFGLRDIVLVLLVVITKKKGSTSRFLFALLFKQIMGLQSFGNMVLILKFKKLSSEAT